MSSLLHVIGVRPVHALSGDSRKLSILRSWKRQNKRKILVKAMFGFKIKLVILY